MYLLEKVRVGENLRNICNRVFFIIILFKP